MKLSTELTLAMVALVLVAAVALGIVAYVPIRSSLYESRLTWLASDSRLLAERLGGIVDKARADVAVMAAAPAMLGVIDARAAGDVDGDAAWRGRLARLFVATLAAEPAYLQLRLIDSEGREIVRVGRTATDAAIQVVPDAALQPKGSRPYVAETSSRPRGEVYVSPIELNREHGTIEEPHVPVLRVGTPVFSSADRPFGIVIVNIDMRPTFDQLRSGAEPHGRIQLVNLDGDYLVHPDRSREFGFELGQRIRLQDEFPDLADTLAGAADARPLTRLVSERDGTDLATAVALKRLGDDNGVAVVLMERRDAVLAAADRVLLSTSAVGLVAILLAVVLAAVLSRSVTRPLARLTAAVDRFNRGEEVELPDGAAREIDVLVSVIRRYMDRERALAAANAINQNIFDTSLDLIYATDRQGNLVRVSPSALEILGYHPSEMEGRSATEFIHGEDLENTRMQMRTARRDGAVLEFDCRYFHKDGHAVALSWKGVWSSAAQLHFFIGRDITERQRADAMFRMAVDASPAAMIMADGDGRILLASREAEEMFGYDAETLVGQPVELLLPDRFRDRHPGLRSTYTAAPSKRMMGTGRDLFARRRDGTEFPVEVGLNPMPTSEGPVVLSVVVDITERKQAEADLAARTHELERSNAELQQFAYVASHDLQEPLRMISSFCDLLREHHADKLDGEAREFIDFAVDGARRMRQMINDLLDYSRLQSRDMTLTAVSAQEALDGALLNLSGAIRENQAEVQHGELPLVHGNLGQLTRLFQNLISNALKFHGHEPPRIEIAAEQDGSNWVISVRDNGIGIDPGQAEAIFGVFQRLHTRDEYPGTGIGLAVCKRIVERHGGRIWVAPTEGPGAEFRFALMSAAEPATRAGPDDVAGEMEFEDGRRAG